MKQFWCRRKVWRFFFLSQKTLQCKNCIVLEKTWPIWALGWSFVRRESYPYFRVILRNWSNITRHPGHNENLIVFAMRKGIGISWLVCLLQYQKTLLYYTCTTCCQGSQLAPLNTKECSTAWVEAEIKDSSRAFASLDPVLLLCVPLCSFSLSPSDVWLVQLLGF